MADLKTNLLGFAMNSPIIGASGTVGYGVEYEELADFTKIGGISGKGLTLHGQYGNKGERLWETPSGLNVRGDKAIRTRFPSFFSIFFALLMDSLEKDKRYLASL